MEQHDTLLTLAEIAAAFVGFSTIVVVFRSSRSELQRLRLRGVAEIGIATLVGSFLPIIATGAGLEEPAVWRASSLVFAAVGLAGWILWARGVSSAGYRPTFGKPPLAPDVVANLVGQTLLWWNVVSPSGAAPTRYVAALMAFLLIAAMSFVASAFGPAGE
ncbi:MAG: hypothetical protein R3195_05990 [Gemmatimonadota bacterium]|nr:hypothetical protein [Gemmatimonadota bacterium]